MWFKAREYIDHQTKLRLNRLLMLKAAVRFFQFYANESFVYVSATSVDVNQEIAVISQSLLELLPNDFISNTRKVYEFYTCQKNSSYENKKQKTAA